MTKTTKPSKARPASAANPRSRAAKRATSPSIDVDKSIKEAPRPSDATPALAATRGGGVSKKQKKKQMTRGQRARIEKGFARAEAVMDQMEKKVDISKSRSKIREQRKVQWENVNGAVKEETRKATKASGQEKADDDWEDVKESNDEDVEMKVADTKKAEPSVSVTPAAPVQHENPAEPVQDDLDLIT